MLNSVYSALKGLLRPPPELFNPERVPADHLTGILGIYIIIVQSIITFRFFYSCIELQGS